MLVSSFRYFFDFLRISREDSLGRLWDNLGGPQGILVASLLSHGIWHPRLGLDLDKLG